MKVRSVLGIVAAFLFLAANLPAQPVVNDFIPPLAGHGETFYVKIYGSGFRPGGVAPSSLVVKFSGTASSAGPTAAVSDSEIDVQDVPASATNGPITVTINSVISQPSQRSFIFVPTNMPYGTNFSPIFGTGGTLLTNYGVHFQTALVTNVTFNGIPAAGFFLKSDNEIDVVVPSGVTNGPIILQSKIGATHNFSTISNVISTATNFFVQPVITTFAPASGRTGTNVILTGANFIGISNVLFSGIPASNFTISNNTTIRATVPDGTSSGRITVLPPNGTGLFNATSTTDFKILPSITSFSPGSGPTNTTITVLGSGLNEKSPRPDVTVGGATVAPAAFGAISPGSLAFNVPANAVSGPITITTSNGTATSAQIFYLPAAITNIAPTNGGLGTSVHISGINFTNTSSVAFNGITTSWFVTNNNHMSAIAPLGVTSGTISVTTPFGTTNSTQLFYVAPTISDFSPSHGLPGVRVTINGTSFTNASAVAFNGTPADSFVVTNNSTLSAVVPTNVITGKITVTAPGGTGQSATDFTLDSADLAVSISDNPDPVFVTSNLVYTVIVTNSGNVSATFVTLSNALPGSALIKSVTVPVGTLVDTNHNPIAFSLGALAANASATVTITVAPQTPGSITNTAFVGSSIPDPNLANNVASAGTTVWPLPFLSISNLMTNGLVQITWPAPLSGFTLQSSTNLSPSVWTTDPTARTVTGTNVSVIETILNTARFYRLTN